MRKAMKGNYVLVGILFLTILFGCKKDSKEPDSTWGTKENELRIYAIENVTFVIKKDNSLWARGGNFTYEAGNKNNGFKLVENNVKKVEGDCCSLYIQKTDNSVWGSKPYFLSDTLLWTVNLPLEKITDGAADISSGTGFLVILKTDGTAWAIGKNSSGEFGLGNRSNNDLPLTLIGTDVKQLATGFSNIYLLKNDGSLWSAGDNLYGKLGYPSAKDQYTFKKISDDIKLVRANASNVMMINNKDEAWSFGSNVNGNQGLGTRNSDPTYPHKIADQVVEVYPNTPTSYFLKTDGSLWASGVHTNGIPGYESGKSTFTFTQVAENVDGMTFGTRAYHVIMRKDSKYIGAGNNEFKQLNNVASLRVKSWEEFVMVQ